LTGISDATAKSYADRYYLADTSALRGWSLASGDQADGKLPSLYLFPAGVLAECDRLITFPAYQNNVDQEALKALKAYLLNKGATS